MARIILGETLRFERDCQRYLGAYCAVVVYLGVGHSHVPTGVNPRPDGVAHASRLDDDWILRVECVRDADNCLEGIALRAARRRAVGHLVAHAHTVVEDLLYQFGRHAGPVVRDSQA